MSLARGGVGWVDGVVDGLGWAVVRWIGISFTAMGVRLISRSL